MLVIDDEIINKTSEFLSEFTLHNDKSIVKESLAQEFFKLNRGDSCFLVDFNVHYGGITLDRDHYTIPFGYKKNIFLDKMGISSDYLEESSLEIYPGYSLLVSEDKKYLIAVTKQQALTFLEEINRKMLSHKKYYSYNKDTYEFQHRQILNKLYEPLFLLISYLQSNQLIDQGESLIDGINKLDKEINKVKTLKGAIA